VRLKTLSQVVLQITRDNQGSLRFMIFRQPKICIFIRRHWQSAFVIYSTIQDRSHTDSDLHHDVAVHPKSHSLLVRPLGLTAGEMYSVGEIHIKTPLTPFLLLPPHIRDVHLCFDPASTRPASGDIRTSNTVQVGINRPPFFLPWISDSRIADGPMASLGIARRQLPKGKYAKHLSS